MSQVAVASRVEPRYEIDGELAVTLIIEPDDYRSAPIEVEATLINLSASGAKLAVPTALEQDKTVRIKLVVDRLGLSFYLSARVCWAAPEGESSSIVGCQLSPNIPEGILQHIAQGGRLNRRDQDRRATSMQVGIARGGIRLWSREKAVIRNYAAGGVCLEMTKSAQLAEVLRLRFAMDELEGVDVVVRWVIQQEDRFLMGCEYQNATSFARLQAVFN
ncbi:MAG: PilZ domain-containing protein [Planctomycetia bacterium]|nr:PilZ domain-containing protein [Planctomycetia bacterium]